MCSPYGFDDLADCLINGGKLKVLPVLLLALQLYPCFSGVAPLYSVLLGADDGDHVRRGIAYFKTHEVKPLRGPITNRKVMEEVIERPSACGWRGFDFLVDPPDQSFAPMN